MRISVRGTFETFPSLILTTLICAFLFSCTLTRQTPKILDEAVPNVHLAYLVERVEITDRRINVSAEQMRIPAWSTPKSYTKHVPAVTDGHREEIVSFCKYNIRGSGPSVVAMVNLVDAYKEFSATFSTERERGYVRMEVILYDVATNEQLISCESTADFGVESRDADQEKMEKVYRYSLRQAVYKCFKSIAANKVQE